MKALAPAALAALTASPALAHAERAIHIHGTDAAVWLVLALVAGLTAAIFLRR